MGTHLYGSTRLLNTASSLVATGGLGEAVSWVVLRQDIYVSLTKSQPLCIRLDHYKQSSSFVNNDAESLANRAVFLCGEVLAYAFGSATAPPSLDIEEWERLQADADSWHMSRPVDSTPYWVDGVRGGRGRDVGSDAANPGSGSSSSSAFPVVWMARPAHGECQGTYLTWKRRFMQARERERD